MERSNNFNLVLIELQYDGVVDIPPGLSSFLQPSNIWSYVTDNTISAINDLCHPILFWDKGFLESLYLLDADLDECDKNIWSILEDFVLQKNNDTLIICTTSIFITRIQQMLLDGNGFFERNVIYFIFKGQTPNTHLHLVLPPKREVRGRPCFVRSTHTLPFVTAPKPPI